jgi:hypothetical protein
MYCALQRLKCNKGSSVVYSTSPKYRHICSCQNSNGVSLTKYVENYQYLEYHINIITFIVMYIFFKVKL